MPIPSWDSKIKASMLQLKARARPQEPRPDDPCLLPGQAGYKRLENQLYRIEIHEPKSASATFKYSRDNGTVYSRIIDISSEKITVSSIGRDRLLGFNNEDWIEITDNLHDSWGIPGILAHIKEVKVDGTDLILYYNSLIPPTAKIDNDSFPQRFNPIARKWDSKGALEISTENNGWIEIEDGIEVKFNNIDSCKTGDYFTIPARTLKADVEWPNGEDGLPEFVDIEGIEYHYAKLALLELSAGELRLISDCRHFFPPLSTLRRKPDLMLTNGMAFKYIDKIGEINKISVNSGAKKFLVDSDNNHKWYIVNAGPTESITLQFIGTVFQVVGDPQDASDPTQKSMTSIDIAPGCGYLLNVEFFEEGFYVGMDYRSDHFIKGGGFYVTARPGSPQHPDETSQLHKLPFIVDPDGNKTSKLTLTAVKRPIKISPDNVITPNGIIFDSTFFVGSYENPQTHESKILNDSPPGPAIILSEGSNLELTFKNDTNEIQGISFQGNSHTEGSMVIVGPGESKTSNINFRHPGVFLYYGIGDAFNAISDRVNEGMYGVIAIFKDDADTENIFCVVFSDFNLSK